MSNPQARPALKDTKADVTDLKGKTLVPFATSGGSGITGSVRELRRAYPDLEWREDDDSPLHSEILRTGILV